MPPRLIYHFCRPVSKFRTENPDRAFKDPPSHGPGMADAHVMRVPASACAEPLNNDRVLRLSGDVVNYCNGIKRRA